MLFWVPLECNCKIRTNGACRIWWWLTAGLSLQDWPCGCTGMTVPLSSIAWTCSGGCVPAALQLTFRPTWQVINSAPVFCPSMQSSWVVKCWILTWLKAVVKWGRGLWLVLSFAVRCNWKHMTLAPVVPISHLIKVREFALCTIVPLLFLHRLTEANCNTDDYRGNYGGLVFSLERALARSF